MCMSTQPNNSEQHHRCRSHDVQKRFRIWREAKRSVITGLGSAAVMLCILATYATLMPPLSAADWQTLRQFPPLSIAQLASQRDVVQKYASQHMVATLIGWCMVYVFMQMFAIPGTASLSLLSGALFGPFRGLLLVAVVSTMGSCACYMMSWLIGKSLAHAIWPERLQNFRAEVAKRKGDLLQYIIFLRVTPILPNIFINIASPVVDVPLFPFVLGTLIGCAPNNFLAVNAGSKLGELKSFSDLYDVKILLAGIAVGLIAVLPVMWKNFSSKRAGQNEATKAAARKAV